MSAVSKSINQVLQDYQNVETSSFYQDFQKFSKQYDSLIAAGFTQRRQSLLKTIQDQDAFSPFSYNIAK